MLEDWPPESRSLATPADAVDGDLLGATVLGFGVEGTQQSSEGQCAEMLRW